MDMVYLVEARYIADYRIFLKFNTGETGEVDLKDLVHQYDIAAPLKDPDQFARFYLDS
jgi:hypothetical protein